MRTEDACGWHATCETTLMLRVSGFFSSDGSSDMSALLSAHDEQEAKVATHAWSRG